MNWPEKTFVKEGEARELLGFTERQWRALLEATPQMKVQLPGYTCAHFRVSELKALRAKLDGAPPSPAASSQRDAGAPMKV